jgi:hypothetical protein
VISRHGPGTRRGSAGGGEQRIDTRRSAIVLVGYDAINRVADDGSQGDVSPARFPSKASHLVFGEGNLGSNHAPMITVALELM